MPTPDFKHFASCLDSSLYANLCFLEEKCKEEAFSAWSCANAQWVVSAFWADEYSPTPHASPEQMHPIFDLASLTKPLFLNLFLRIVQQTQFAHFVAKPVAEVLKQHSLLGDFFARHEHITIDSLLSHRSGFRAWRWMGVGKKDPQNACNAIVQHVLKTGFTGIAQEEYSDLNYFLLARVLEYLYSGTTWTEVLNTINQHLSTHFQHASIHGFHSTQCVPYFSYELIPKDLQKTTPLFGHVHDTNANILSSLEEHNIVSGHAGFFGSAFDICKAIPFLAKTQQQAQNFSLQTNRTSRFCYGLDTPTTPQSTAGLRHYDQYKNSVFGHLGYTGTSFWWQGEKQHHILLTNRTAKRQTQLEHPRIYVLSNAQKNQHHFFSQLGKKTLELNFDSLRETLFFYTERHIKKWDSKDLSAPCDLADVRRTVAKNLWDI